ncbi:MAG: hypothetical protein ABIH77_01955, partial [Pseudomonadota bacterium]
MDRESEQKVEAEKSVEETTVRGEEGADTREERIDMEFENEGDAVSEDSEDSEDSEVSEITEVSDVDDGLFSEGGAFDLLDEVTIDRNLSLKQQVAIHAAWSGNHEVFDALLFDQQACVQGIESLEEEVASLGLEQKRHAFREILYSNQLGAIESFLNANQGRNQVNFNKKVFTETYQKLSGSIEESENELLGEIITENGESVKAEITRIEVLDPEYFPIYANNTPLLQLNQTLSALKNKHERLKNERSDEVKKKEKTLQEQQSILDVHASRVRGAIESWRAVCPPFLMGKSEDEIRDLFEKEGPITLDFVDAYNMNLLHYTVMKEGDDNVFNRMRIAACLLDAGLSPDQESVSGQTPIFMAGAHSNLLFGDLFDWAVNLKERVDRNEGEHEKFAKNLLEQEELASTRAEFAKFVKSYKPVMERREKWSNTTFLHWFVNATCLENRGNKLKKLEDALRKAFAQHSDRLLVAVLEDVLDQEHPTGALKRSKMREAIKKALSQHNQREEESTAVVLKRMQRNIPPPQGMLETAAANKKTQEAEGQLKKKDQQIVKLGTKHKNEVRELYAEMDAKLSQEKAAREEMEEKLSQEKAEMEEKLSREKAEMEEKLSREKAEMEEKLSREKAAREELEVQVDVKVEAAVAAAMA